MKILFHFLRGFGSLLTAVEKVGYTKFYTSRGFELDKRNLAMDALNIRQDAVYSVELLNKDFANYHNIFTITASRSAREV